MLSLTRVQKSQFIMQAFPLRMFAALLVSGALASIFPPLGGLVAILCALFAIVAAAVGILKALITVFVRRLRTQSAQYLIRAVITLLLIVPCLRAGDYIHLALFYPYYATVISDNAAKTDPIRFEWGELSLWSPNGMHFRTLVYNPSGASKKCVSADDCLEREQRMRLSLRHLLGPFFIEDEISIDEPA